jgi:hypothetical protein
MRRRLLARLLVGGDGRINADGRIEARGRIEAHWRIDVNGRYRGCDGHGAHLDVLRATGNGDPAAGDSGTKGENALDSDHVVLLLRSRRLLSREPMALMARERNRQAYL